MQSNSHNLEILYVKNMVCNCSKLFLKEKLEDMGLYVKEISLGKIKIIQSSDYVSHEKINSMLNRYGFDLIHSREDRIIEDIKIAVIELIHHSNNVDSIIRKSDYLVEKLGLSYQYMSKVFSEHQHTTLEKYIIHQKVERIKHLIDSEEFTLSEISYMMDYSSVQYLSNQFKSITGITVSQYKESDRTYKVPIDQI